MNYYMALCCDCKYWLENECPYKDIDNKRGCEKGSNKGNTNELARGSMRLETYEPNGYRWIEGIDELTLKECFEEIKE